jgi:ribosomal protein S18 acetylase RimI-like enzyme
VHADVGHYLYEGQLFQVSAAPAPYTIGEATAADMPAIRAMLTRAFAIPADVIAAGYPDDFFIKAAPSRLFVSRDGAGNVVGAVGARSQSSAIMLFGLAVDPQHRRLGLARAVTQTAMAATAERSKFMHAITNEITGALAASLGAREVGRWLHLLRGPASLA